MINWEKEELERLINEEKLSYQEIGRRYGVTGNGVKKAAKKLGITLPQRRKINPKETFNKGCGKTSKCLNCGKEIACSNSVHRKFCSSKCMGEYWHKNVVSLWKNGEYVSKNKYFLPKFIKQYLLEKTGYKCEKCGFCGTNPYTNKTILQIHHIDGDCFNNNEANLQVLCPNCHAMTENFGHRNKKATRGRSGYFGKAKTK